MHAQCTHEAGMCDADYKHASDYLRDWFCGIKKGVFRTMPLRLLEQAHKQHDLRWRKVNSVGSAVSDRKKVIYRLLEDAGLRSGTLTAGSLHAACEQLQQEYVLAEETQKGRRPPTASGLHGFCWQPNTFCATRFEKEVFGWDQRCAKPKCSCLLVPVTATGVADLQGAFKEAV